MTLHGSRTTDGRGRLYDSIVDTIGNTPCIRVNHIAPKHVRMYVKAEYFNPAASVKDRLAISIIEEAERRAVELLQQHGDTLHEIARILQEKEVISGDEIKRLVQKPV
mgnify:CR=1 FL=1